jgi:hypothetical protein
MPISLALPWAVGAPVARSGDPGAGVCDVFGEDSSAVRAVPQPAVGNLGDPTEFGLAVRLPKAFGSIVARSGRPRVLDKARGAVSIERGDLARLSGARKIAILAQFSTEVRVSRSFRTLVAEFVRADYLPVVVSASPVSGCLEWNGELPDSAIVVRQPNLGYDFGSWAIGLNLIGASRSAPYIVLANDSIVGPFASLRPLLHDFEATSADVWGLTDNYQYTHHLQSYFMGFRNGVLADGPLRRFFDNVRIEPTKWDIIHRYELGLTRLLSTEGYTAVAAFRAETLVAPGENPVIKGWWKLLENGYPFIKREIVRDPSVAPRSQYVSTQVLAIYGEVVEDWL